MLKEDKWGSQKIQKIESVENGELYEEEKPNILLSDENKTGCVIRSH